VDAKARLVEKPRAKEGSLLAAQAARDVHPGGAGEGLDSNGVGTRLDDSKDLGCPFLRSSVQCGLFKGGCISIVL
jgi:hypothetical protein